MVQQQRPLGLILVFILLGLVGQYLFKGGMSLPVSKELVSLIGQDLATGAFGSGLLHIVHLLLHPLILSGLAAYALSTACWLAVLSKTDLSFAYPMLSIGYVAILLMGWIAFDEHVTLLRWLGVLLISVGILGIYSERRFLQFGYLMAATLVAVAGAVLMTAAAGSPAEIKDKPFALLLLSIVMGLVGQVLFKAGMNRPAYKEQISAIGALVRSVRQKGPAPLGDAVVSTVLLFLRPFIVGGLACYGISTVCYLVVLGRTPLSFAYPMLALGYVAILLMGWLLFHERVTAVRWFGVVLIIYGIVAIYSEEMVHQYAGVYAGGLVAMALFLSLAARSARNASAGSRQQAADSIQIQHPL